MTTKDIPTEAYTEVCEGFYGADFHRGRHLDLPPAALNPVADREGATNPSGSLTRFEWDTDLTAQEEADFDVAVKRATLGGSTGPSDAEVEAAIDQMQLFLGRPVDPTAQQTWDTIDAILTYLKYLHTKD